MANLPKVPAIPPISQLDRGTRAGFRRIYRLLGRFEQVDRLQLPRTAHILLAGAVGEAVSLLVSRGRSMGHSSRELRRAPFSGPIFVSSCKCGLPGIDARIRDQKGTDRTPSSRSRFQAQCCVDPLNILVCGVSDLYTDPYLDRAFSRESRGRL